MCRFKDDVRNENTQNVALLGKLGACHVVVNCLKVHGANDPELAAVGMCAVRNLASSNAGYPRHRVLTSNLSLNKSITPFLLLYSHFD